MTTAQTLELVRIETALDRMWRRVRKLDKSTNGRGNEALGHIESAMSVFAREVERARNEGDIARARQSLRSEMQS